MAVIATQPMAQWRLGLVTTRALVVGVVGFVLCAIGVVFEPRQAFASYLFAYVAVLTIVVGALMMVMISHVTAARWFTVLRRLTLLITAALPTLAVLVLPIILGVHRIYPWAGASVLPPGVTRRAAWLNVPFFSVRAVIYVLVFAICGEMLRRWALMEDEIPVGVSQVDVVRRQRRLSAFGVIIVGFAITLVAFDWLMPLDPRWFSTVYGVYVFSGGFVAALGLVALLAYISISRGGALAGTVNAEHFGALGKLMLTFVIFWVYIAFSQFLVIWIGDIPADASWYVVRGAGSWRVLALCVLVGQFAIPFVLLLSRPLKRRPAALAAIGALILAMHVVDVFWLVTPAFHPTGFHVSWLDLAALLMVGGLATAAAAWRGDAHASIPVNDPYLAQSVQYAEP
ncbi:MAG: hypothetical protein M3Z30_04270 [Gemmatimonadota bacterium]|nr:hypothetical protein [Gemmatimonadota bacterium]